jgi:hypothetical protein
MTQFAEVFPDSSSVAALTRQLKAARSNTQYCCIMRTLAIYRHIDHLVIKGMRSFYAWFNNGVELCDKYLPAVSFPLSRERHDT